MAFLDRTDKLVPLGQDVQIGAVRFGSVARKAGIDVERSPRQFSDTRGNAHEGSINGAALLGIAAGTGDGKYHDDGGGSVPISGGTGWPQAKSLALIPEAYRMALATREQLLAEVVEDTQPQPERLYDELFGTGAIVTGGATGIGRAIALELARHGVHIAFNYFDYGDGRVEAEAERTANELRNMQVTVVCRPCDVRDAEAVGAFVAEADHSLSGRLSASLAWVSPGGPLGSSTSTSTSECGNSSARP